MPSWGSEIHFLDKPYMETLAESANPSADDPEDTDLPYQRFGNDEGMEPLVIVRRFPGNLPQDIEILEEFRLFHNLRFDLGNSAYVKYDNCGDETEVIRIENDIVKARRKEIRQFLTARKMSLIVYLDRHVWSNLSIDEIGQQPDDADKSEKNYVHRYVIRITEISTNKDFRTISFLRGKVAIHGVPSINANDDASKYVDFLIGYDENDKRIHHTCDPAIVDPLFSADTTRSAPFLTKVFFRRKVLNKYINEPSKYDVEESSIGCRRRWLMEINSNHKKYVVVYLGDLGNLPFREQLHWYEYNLPPDGEMSEVDYRRTILAEFTEPEDSALRFKRAYQIFLEACAASTGWPFFKPLRDADSHHFKRLRIPSTSEFSELEGLMLSLSVVLCDSINGRKIKQVISSFKAKDDQGNTKLSITILEEFLIQSSFDRTEVFIQCLRTVQDFRSKGSHRKGRNYENLANSVQQRSRTTKQVADDIFTTLSDFLDSLRAHFCENDND